jgi:hypothetical protein
VYSLYLREGFHHRDQQTRLFSPGAPAKNLLGNELAGTVAFIGRTPPEAGFFECVMDSTATIRAKIWASFAGFLVEGEVLRLVEREPDAAKRSAARAIRAQVGSNHSNVRYEQNASRRSRHSARAQEAGRGVANKKPPIWDDFPSLLIVRYPQEQAQHWPLVCGATRRKKRQISAIVDQQLRMIRVVRRTIQGEAGPVGPRRPGAQPRWHLGAILL